MKRSLILFVAVLLMLCHGHILGYMLSNGSECVYENCGDLNGGNSKSSILSVGMSDLIVNSAKEFFWGYIGTLNILVAVEEKDSVRVNYDDLEVLIDTSIDHISFMRDYYSSLVTIASNSEYKLVEIEKLTDFDYIAFKQKYPVNSSVYNDVQYYLKNGQVSESYVHMQGLIDCLMVDLNVVKKDIELKTINIQNYLNLNNSFSELNLFGQYIANIFLEIKK